MTKEEKQMRDFISEEMMKRDFDQEQLNELAAVLYPHNGSEEGVRAATRKFTTDIITWAARQEKQEADKKPKPMTEEEIEALAAIL